MKTMNVMKGDYSNQKSVDHVSIQSDYPNSSYEGSKNNYFVELVSQHSFDNGINNFNENTVMKESSSVGNIFTENRPSASSKVLNIRQKIGSENKDTNKSKIINRNGNYIMNNVQYTHTSQIFERRSLGTQYDTIENKGKILINSQSYTKCNYINAPNNNTTTNPYIADYRKSNLIVNQNRYAEKTTYCRPVIDYYNQAFVYKTMQKNERLQKIVKKLAIARQKERQTEAWNNFINDLKNKHGYNNEEKQFSGKQYGRELIDDGRRPGFTWGESNQCTKLLQNFYDHLNIGEAGFSYYRPLYYEYENNSRNSPRPEYLHNDHSSKTYCYPISSQARTLMLDKEREFNEIKKGKIYEKEKYLSSNYCECRPFNNSVIVDRECKNRTENYKNTDFNIYRKFEARRKLIMNIINSSAVQTEYIQKEPITREIGNNYDKVNENEETLQEEYKKVSENVERLKRKNEENKNEHKEACLATIEAKLDVLIKSINSFIIEIQGKKVLERNDKSVLLSCKSCNFNNNNKAKSEIFEIVRHKPMIHKMLTDSSRSTIETFDNDPGRYYKHRGPEIDEIIIEEMDKSEKVKRDIENILKGNVKYPCSVQITVDIPTKERSTEVTASISQAKVTEVGGTEDLRGISEKILRNERRMTIAVNTDPLGLLALLRVSTETVKQLLSYMPNIPYHTYLPRISLGRHLMRKNDATEFVCNICGAVFTRPSLLSDHIYGHNLGRVRDCCVCRHSVDVESRKRRGLFKCRYCGQRFTRAYCCDLHQQSCAKTVGRQHDVTSSHILLK